MEAIAHYLRLAFLSAVVILPIAAVMFLAIRTKSRKNPGNQTFASRLQFYKALMIISGAFIPIYFLIYSLFLRDIPYLKYDSDKQFVSEQLKPFMNHKMPNDSAEAEFQKQSLLYLKTRYQDNIYFSNFKFDKADSIELNFIMHYIRHPELNDSAKLELRNKVQTTNDIKEYLTD